MTHELVAVSDSSDWAAFHAIRRVELFEAKGRFGIYNDQHPDDHADFAHPFLLKVDGLSVGTVRIDRLGQDRGAIRLVAITATAQGRGLGKLMEGLAVEQARELGVSELVVNAAAEAVGFYEKMGWSRYDWDPAELVNIAAACIQMRKLL